MAAMKSKIIMESPSEANFDRANFDSESTFSEKKPSPADMELFLPWACQQLSIDAYLEIAKATQAAYVAEDRRKRKEKKKILSDSAKSITSIDDQNHKSIEDYEYKVVRIAISYSGDKLVQIKIQKTKHLPREVLAIINLIIKFYPHLTSFYINSGANKYTIHEMCKFLPFSNITEINLDNTSIKEANYDDILENAKQLKVLSLSRCSLHDDVIERIASKLEYPLPCSKTLSVLNLSSNRLTNNSAKYLGKMLRTNRCLIYLNLAGNMITDDGMEVMLNSLYKFYLTKEEIFMNRSNYINFLRRKQCLIDGHIKMLQQTEPTTQRNKFMKRATVAVTKKASAEKIRHQSLTGPMNAFYEKALKLANLECGDYVDLFGQDTFCADDDGTIYSVGNCTLAYLNIAYNSISHISVKLLLKILKHQQALTKTSKGLINIFLEGNPIPEKSPELIEIETILLARIVKEKYTINSLRRKSVISAQSTSQTKKLLHKELL